MKICIAQTKPLKGNIEVNIEAHKRFVELALTNNANAIFFPELSISGYEPELSKKLAINKNDFRLDVFQEISDSNDIIIGIGIPTISVSKPKICMLIFESKKPREIYSKQLLHSDELPYFESGNEQLLIKVNETHIAPAICYESLQTSHAETAFNLGANVYLASVAKPANGVEKAYEHYPAIAKRNTMPILMANCVGNCDNFLSVGQSAVWTKDGKLVAKLDDKSEGILIFDTETETAMKKTLNRQ